MDKLLDKRVEKLLRFYGVFTVDSLPLVLSELGCSLELFIDSVNRIERSEVVRCEFVGNRKQWWHSLSNPDDSDMIDEFYLEFIKMCRLGPVTVTAMSQTVVGAKIGISRTKDYMAELLVQNRIKKVRKFRGYQMYDVVIDSMNRL